MNFNLIYSNTRINNIIYSKIKIKIQKYMRNK